MPTPLYSPGMSHMCVVVWVSCLCHTVLWHLGVLVRTLDPARARRSSREYHHSPTRARFSLFSPLPSSPCHSRSDQRQARNQPSASAACFVPRSSSRRASSASVISFCSHPPTPLLLFWCPAKASAPARSSVHNVSLILSLVI
jgi:hypothetical protein